MELIADLGSSDDSGFGGKGRSLNLLMSLGLPVPPGFVITTEGVAAIQKDADALTGTISEHLSRIDDGLFAVRSSSTSEDGVAASFAGLHETFLGVSSKDVEGAVERCISSLETERAKAYRGSMGLASDEMAVVVQQMVAADASAVAFTTHPITGDEGVIFVNATLGLGEPLVSGEITPDTFVISKHSGEMIERDIGPKEFVQMLGSAGPERQEGPFNSASLKDEDIAALMQICLLAEGKLGYAVDSEVALAKGAWWLLQARPITT